MTLRTLHRAWPALGTLVLLALAAAGPAPVRTGPAPPAQAAATCDPFSQTGGGASTYTFNTGTDGIRQPFPDGMPLAVCSLSVAATGWNYARVAMLEWDPLAFAPDPHAIALRTAFCDPSDLNYYTSNALPKFTFVPPIITRSLAGVADPPRTQVAMQVTQSSSNFPYSFVGHYAAAGDLGMPSAHTYGAIPALAGAHPVAAHALCDGGGALEALRVVQAVNRTDSEAPLGRQGYLQRFRVPEAVEVHWVEVAVNELAQSNVVPVTVSFVDASGFAEPPVTLPAPLAQSTLFTWFYKQPGPRWAAPVDFDHAVHLFPDRDYWLSLSNAQTYKYRAHTLTQDESESFTYAIGAFHHRAQPDQSWSHAPDQALSFKLVGVSLGSPLSVAPRTGFLLSVTPNPARAVPEAAWSGATGPVKVQVYDARGRRVATGGGGAAGRWAVQARDARPLAAGVYFVHATDSEGARAVERVVIVR